MGLFKNLCINQDLVTLVRDGIKGTVLRYTVVAMAYDARKNY